MGAGGAITGLDAFEELAEFGVLGDAGATAGFARGTDEEFSPDASVSESAAGSAEAAARPTAAVVTGEGA